MDGMAVKIWHVFTGATHIHNTVGHSTDAFSLVMWHHLKGNETGFPLHSQEILLQQRNDQPNANIV